MKSVYQLLEHAADTWPTRIALVDEWGAVSYRELYTETETLKNILRQAEIGAGMGLAVMGRNNRVFVAAMLAGMGCGAVVVPLSHQLKLAETEQIILDTGVQVLLDDQSGAVPDTEQTSFFSLFAQSLRFTWLKPGNTQPITPLPDASFIRYTSGTTGQSKGVVLTHNRILERVDSARHALQLGSEDAVLWVLPMAFHFLVSVLVYIRVGAKIIICKDLLAATLIREANQHQATVLYASPMHYRLLAADKSGEQLLHLKSAISTSSAIPFEIAEQFRQRFNLSVIQTYGIIEAGLPLIDNLSGNQDTKSVGFPAHGFTVSILDEQYQPVKEGQVGRLAIRGPGMFDAYLQPWRTAAQVMEQGWFMTGDLASIQPDGRVVIGGREKSMINVSGNKAFPEEIEAVLNSHPAVIACRVFGQAHPLMGEVVCADVVLKQEAAWDVEALLQFCRQRLSTYKVPQRLQRVMEISNTASGKVKRSH